MHSRNFFLFLSCRIFRWLRHGILHLFQRCYLHGEICKTKQSVFRILAQKCLRTYLLRNSENRQFCFANYSSFMAPTEKSEYTTTQPMENPTRWRQKKISGMHSTGRKLPHKVGVFGILKKSLNTKCLFFTSNLDFFRTPFYLFFQLHSVRYLLLERCKRTRPIP